MVLTTLCASIHQRGVARENLLMIHCDDRLKHDRLLTLIWLFEYRNTRTRVLLVHDDKQHTTTYLHRVQQFMYPTVCMVVLTLHKIYWR